MALVTKIIGNCPGCGAVDSFGNVDVGDDTLKRGCLKCRHWVRVPLPPLNKRIIYLDQFFYSHAFRGSNPAFVAAKKRIQDLSHKEVLVAPYSELHDDETHQWVKEQRGPLWDFIKHSSAGHQFKAEHDVRMAQLHRAFDAFIKGKAAEQVLEGRDALPREINKWNSYFWIDVGSFRTDPEKVRDGKKQSLEGLLDLFPTWANRQSSFEQDFQEELKGGSQSYLNLYVQYVKRMANGDFKAFSDSPLNSQIVEQLMHHDGNKLPGPLRMQRLQAFFESPHFARAPIERISAELFALLRTYLRAGAFSSREKAKKHFKGFFFDVRFISTYAPYCDAMVVDTLMHRWVSDPLVNLSGRFGTKFFSRANWGGFMTYLDEIESEQSPEVRAALGLVHPPNAKTPNWVKQ